MAFLGLYQVSVFLLVLHFDSCTSDMHCIYLYIFPSPLLLLVTNSTVFHLPPCSPTRVLQCNYIISLLSFPSVMYILSSFVTIPSSISHSSSFSVFIPTLFSFSTAFTTLLSSSYALLILFFRSPSSIIVLAPLIYSGFISFWSLLSFSTPSCQLGLLLSLSVFFMLFPGTCFNVKLNRDRYKAHLACLQFNFWLVIKYWRFLWSVQISNSSFAPFKQYLHASRHLITASISLL